MQKTFCDRCGEPCVNLVVYVNITERHTTADGEEVGTDEYRMQELCGGCGGLVKQGLPALQLGHRFVADSPAAMPSSCEVPAVPLPG